MIHNISRFIAALALLATAQGAWAWDGNGTVSDPYQIKSTADLDQLATDVNSGTEHEGDYFVLTTDLTYSHETDWNDANSTENNYTPIGGYNNTKFRFFKGHFDGQSHTISGIRIYQSGNEAEKRYAALFGQLSNGAEVKNVFLADARFTGYYYCGPIVGNNNGRVENCHVLSDVTVHAVTTDADYHGGVVGYNDGTITGCTSAASITAAVSCKNNGGITGRGTGTVEDCIYFGSTVAGDRYVGAIIGYAVSGSTVRNCYYTSTNFTGKNSSGTALTNDASAIGYKKSDATIDDVRLATSDDFAVSGDTYTIGTAAGWSVMCAALYHNDTFNRFSGKTVRLDADITVTRMAGGSGHEFTGTFDGDGKTLTVNYANTDNNTRTAPFSYVDGATIQNLIVGGTISGTAYRAAGIIGETGNTTSHITNCVSNVDISSGRYTGGFSIGGNVEIEGCVFNGKINGTTYSGGFIGYSYSAQVIKNSLFAPQDGSSISGGTFYYNGGGDVAPVNSYYTQALGTAQGKACHSVTADADVTIEAVALTGTATQYTVSGITAYSGGGLQRGQTLYYGSDDQLSLTLSNTATPQGYQYAYTASAGTLSGQTLTMPDADVTISATLAPIDWATVNQGNSEDDPYMIYNKDQLLLLAHRVNGTNGETANTYQGMYFKLGADITFTHDAVEGDDYAENYEAIGNGYHYFKGNFDGANHTVSGIRIRKTGTGISNNYLGIFGQTSDGSIHDVHLTDARIKGYSYVGGIVGYNTSSCNVSGCTVTDSYITATTTTSNYYGTICGYNNTGYYGGHLTNNYYHGCTVNGTAVTSGMGCKGADLTDNNGALPAYAITFGDGVSTTALASAPENGFVYNGVSYYREGLALPLASEAPEGYTLSFSANGTALSGNTYTVNATDGDVTINTTLRSDGQQHEVSYTEADGSTQTAQAVALDGTETSLAAGWYYVGNDISYNATVTLDGDVHLILADGKTMNVTTTGDDHKDYCINAPDGQSLHIYGQTEGTGVLNAQTKGNADGVIYIEDGTLGIHGGNVTATVGGTPDYLLAICVYRTTAGDALVIDRGTLTANGNSSDGIYIEGGDAHINGGQVAATGASAGITVLDAVVDFSTTIPGILTLSGGTLTASGFDTYSGESYAGTLAVASGHTYTDGTSLYDSATETATLAALGGKTLQPCLALADAADNTAAITAAITDHAGKTLAVALSGRTLYKDGSWNTLCLPFSVTTASGTLSGDNVQAMTLNTTRSNFADGTLTLNFTAAETIPAGTPFIIKWDESGTDITNPVFEGVTIDATKHDATVTGVLTFTGTYAPVSIGSEGDNTKLYLGSSNTLHYPNGEMTIGCHRAYFQLKQGLSVGDPSSSAHAIVLNFGGGTTSVQNVQSSMFNVQSDDWYTLDGRKLNGKPTQRGIYIHKGNKIVINRL